MADAAPDRVSRRGKREIADLLCRVAATVHAAEADGLDDAINQALALLGEFAAVDRSCVLRFPPNRQTFTQTHEWCAPGIHSQLDYFVNLPLTAFPWTARQLLKGRVVATDGLDDYPPEAQGERQICIDEGIQSIVFVPFRSRGRVIGATGFDSIRSTRRWTPGLIRVLKVSGSLFGACLEQRRAECELRHVSGLERRKLGQDLHDTLGQQLAGISYCAAALAKALRVKRSSLAVQAEDIGAQAVSALSGVRDLIRGLQPFDLDGAPVNRMLMRMAEDVRAQTGVVCEFQETGNAPIEDPETCTQLLWIAREAVQNAVRHGKAKRICIALAGQREKRILTISDDGVGFPDDFLETDGVGLKVMRYRAAAMGGQVTLFSGAQGGTRVQCVFRCRSTAFPAFGKQEMDFSQCLFYKKAPAGDGL